MSEVGIRELRDHLSHYIGEVRAGSEITVTDHGKAVARIVPLEGPRTLDRLIAQGLVTPAEEPKRSLPKRVVPTEPVSPLVAEQRR